MNGATNWAPPPVLVKVAEALQSVFDAHPRIGLIGERLLTAEMKNTWNYLQSLSVTEEAISSLNENEKLENWEIYEYHVSLNERALAGFYIRVVFGLGNRLPEIAVTRAEAEANAKPWLDAAELCRHDRDFGFLPRVDPRLNEALALVAAYLEKEGQDRKGEGSIFVVERDSRSRGDNQLRVAARIVADATRPIFGAAMYGTIATILSVAFDTGKCVTPKQAENWVRGPSQ